MHLAGILADVTFGPYLNAWKVLPIVLVLLGWAKLLTWADKDAADAYLPRAQLNIANLTGMILGFALFLILPNFWIALPGMLVIFGAEVGIYLQVRNKKVGLADLKKQIRNGWKNFGKKEKEVEVVAGAVGLIGKSGGLVAPPKDEDPSAPGYKALQEILTDPLKKNAELIEVTPTEEGSTVRCMVDGVRYDVKAMTKDAIGAAVNYLKSITSLDPNERRKPQSTNLKATINGRKLEMKVTTSGSSIGDSLMAEVDPKKKHELRLADLGFSTDQMALVEGSIKENDSGIVLLCAPRGQGLTSLLYGVLRGHDAFLQHIHTIERAVETDLEGITQNKLAPNATAADEVKLVGWISSQEPDIVLMNPLNDRETAEALIKFAAGGKRVYIGMRAGSTFEALEQWRKLVGDDKLAMKELKWIVAGRVMRRLCTACKLEYAPDPDTLRRLNMPPEKVGRLYQERNTPLRDPKGNPLVCEFCQDLRFRGRFGVFEVFVIDDEVKQTVLGGGSVNQLKMLFKKQKRRYLQENALLKAVAGETSLKEVARVLRIGAPPPSSGGGGAPAAARPSSSKPRPARQEPSGGAA